MESISNVTANKCIIDPFGKPLNNINDIRIVNLDEAVTTMFPLLEPSFDDLANQIIKNQSLDNITYADDNKYTSMVLLNAIKTSLGKAAAPSPSPASSASPSPK